MWLCLHWSAVLKTELGQRKRLSVYRSIYVLNKSMRSWIRKAETSFQHRVAGISIILEGLGIESLLLHIERTQLEKKKKKRRGSSWGSSGIKLRRPPGHLSISEMSNWVETTGQSQDVLHVSFGLRTPQCSSGRTRKGDQWERRRSGHLCLDCCPYIKD